MSDSIDLFDNPTASSSTTKRCTFSKDSRQIIWNVYRYFQENNEKGNLIDTVVQATGVSRTTIIRVIREGKAVELGTQSDFKIPRQDFQKNSPKSSVDKCSEEAIRRIVYNFHITDKQRPTLAAIYNKIKDDQTIGFTGKESSFRKLLIKLGFRWQKTTDNRQLLMERHDVRSLRTSYIRAITKYRAEGRPIIYTDESYIHASHTTSYQWADKSNKGLNRPISKGQRLIIVHAGSDNGFVNNALLIFKSGQKSGDYHDEMNSTNYNRWLEHHLIPNLPKNSVVVMDNASYHNVLATKIPHSNNKKDEMKTWLDERGIIYDLNSTKVELYDLILRNKPNHKQYQIDALFGKHGHSVCRLPPYHPELNPIEKIWGIAKNWVATKNITFKLNDVEKLLREKINSIDSSQWLQVCEHVKKIEKEYIEREHIQDSYCEPLIFNINGSSDEDMSDWSDEEL